MYLMQIKISDNYNTTKLSHFGCTDEYKDYDEVFCSVYQDLIILHFYHQIPVNKYTIITISHLIFHNNTVMCKNIGYNSFLTCKASCWRLKYLNIFVKKLILKKNISQDCICPQGLHKKTKLFHLVCFPGQGYRGLINVFMNK